MLELVPKEENHLEWILDMSCMVLSEKVGLGRPLQILCSRGVASRVKKAAQRKRLAVRYISKHFGEEVRAQERMVRTEGVKKKEKRIQRRKHNGGRKYQKKMPKKRKGSRNKIHRTYLDVKLLYKWYEAFDSKYDIVKLETIGQSLEGREIKIVKINSENEKYPVIFIDAGVHAREWISPAAVMFFIDKLVRMIMKGKGQENVAKFQWHIIPLANPDGYQYSIDKDRMWRKNRQENPGSDCAGVDLNRNFPLAFGTASSSNPCDEDFRGTNAFSEKESATMRDYLDGIKDRRQAEYLNSDICKTEEEICSHSKIPILFPLFSYTRQRK